MNKDKLKQILMTLLESAVIVAIVLFALNPMSCKITSEGIKILDGDYTPPTLQDITVIDSNTVRILFSEKVKLTGCVVSPFIENVSDSEDHSENESLSESLAAAAGSYGSISVEIQYDESGKIVDVKLSERMEIGKKYELYGVVKDDVGNTLTFSAPFVGFNENVPNIIMTEIQSESVSSQNSKEKENGTYRLEFIEFLALTDGNLSGLEILSGYDGETKKYSFPCVEVQKGEVFTVHLRNKGNGCVNEIGENVDLAFSSYCGNEVRDLWAEEESTVLGNKTDVIVLRNAISGQILDGVMYRAEDVTEWSKNMEEYAFWLSKAGIYKSNSTEEASVTTGLTGTKTFMRLDGFELQKKVLDGEEIQYPVAVDSESWGVASEVTAGYL